MKRHLFYLLISLFSCLRPGFDPLTVIHTSQGLEVIQNLDRNSLLLAPSINCSEKVRFRPLVKYHSRVTSRVIALTVEAETIIVTRDQLVYLPIEQQWERAENLRVSESLLTYQGEQVPITAIECINQPFTCISLSIEAPHTLAIGRAGIVMHNVAPALLGAPLYYAAYFSLAPEVTTVAVAAVNYTAVAIGINYIAWKTWGMGLKDLVVFAYKEVAQSIKTFVIPTLQSWRDEETADHTSHASAKTSSSEESFDFASIEDYSLPNIEIDNGHAEALKCIVESQRNKANKDLPGCGTGKIEKEKLRRDPPTCGTGMLKPDVPSVGCGTGKLPLPKQPTLSCGLTVSEFEPKECNFSKGHRWRSRAWEKVCGFVASIKEFFSEDASDTYEKVTPAADHFASDQRIILFKAKEKNHEKKKKNNPARNSLGGKEKSKPEDRYKLPKVENISQFFELPFGKEIRNSCEPAGWSYDGSPVYKVVKYVNSYFQEGFEFYLDNFHKDHLEILNSEGKVKFVLNLDGSENLAKSKKARKENRRVRR